MRQVCLLAALLLLSSHGVDAQHRSKHTDLYPRISDRAAIQVVTAQAEPQTAKQEDLNLRVAGLLKEGNALYDAKDYVGAATVYHQATEAGPSSFGAWFNLGVAELAAERYEAAKAAFNKAELLRPDSSRVYEYLGVTAEALNEEAEAAVAYKSALEHDRQSLTANNNLGHLLLRQGRYADAEAYLQQALRTNPDSMEAFGGLCMTTSFLREHVQSLEACTRAAELGENSGVFVYLLANAQYNLEQYSTAVTTYGKARELGVDGDLVANGLAYCYLHLGEYEQSLKLFQQAVAANPKLVEAYTGMGALYYKMRRFKDAVKSFQVAVNSDPQSSDARYSLALSCLSLQRRDCALEQYNSLKSIDTQASNKLFKQIFRGRVVDARSATSQ